MPTVWIAIAQTPAAGPNPIAERERGDGADSGAENGDLKCDRDRTGRNSQGRREWSCLRFRPRQIRRQETIHEPHERTEQLCALFTVDEPLQTQP
jgi:hypothetical protein